MISFTFVARIFHFLISKPKIEIEMIRNLGLADKKFLNNKILIC